MRDCGEDWDDEGQEDDNEIEIVSSSSSEYHGNTTPSVSVGGTTTTNRWMLVLVLAGMVGTAAVMLLQLQRRATYHPNHRLVAYVGNWQDCPTDAQLHHYTHIVIAFAVSYIWTEQRNVCSETCAIYEPKTCGNAKRPETIRRWKRMGKKVILGYGGSGMGGNSPEQNCWEYCFGREPGVVDQLVEIVRDNDLDGVDINYEFFLEDHLPVFARGAEARAFLRNVTLGLRDKLPGGAELSHAPVDPDLVPGIAYFDLLRGVGDSLDYLLPEYYNGYIHSDTDFSGALDRYTTLAEDVFGGDASKIVFGFCIKDCQGYNLNGTQAAAILERLAAVYPCHGGASFWVALRDTDGSWSSVVGDRLAAHADRCKTLQRLKHQYNNTSSQKKKNNNSHRLRLE